MNWFLYDRDHRRERVDQPQWKTTTGNYLFSSMEKYIFCLEEQVMG